MGSTADRPQTFQAKKQTGNYRLNVKCCHTAMSGMGSINKIIVKNRTDDINGIDIILFNDGDSTSISEFIVSQ